MNDFELAKFWENDALAHQNNCFADAPQVALGIRMSDECVFAELGVEGQPWGYTPREVRIDLNKRYNDLSEKIVGKRLLREEFLPDDAKLPYVKRIGEVFGGEYIMHNETEWLKEGIPDAEALEKKLDEVEKMDLRAFILPKNWEEEKKRVYEKYGVKPSPVHHIRGPVTLACSLMGTTEFLYFLSDEPELAARWANDIADVTIKIAEIMDEEAGRSGKETHGFSFADDNCCLLSPKMYELFGYPVLKKVFDRFSPDPEDGRYQHSDSAMEHIVPILGRLDLNGVNFGPTVMAPYIRQYLPHARIDGCIAPFSFMHNNVEELTEQTLRDIKAGFEVGGVNISTAGSINNGSLLSSMRLIMEIIWDNRKK